MYVSKTEEKDRYLTHNNDVNDPRYQNFVSPLFTTVNSDFPKTAKGLDFGAGTGPVIAKMLSEKGYSVALYDPFFHPNTEVLEKQYDFIVCCEVMEHFHNPNKEFKLLERLLAPKGKLYCMTDLVPKNIKFSDWYYKNDNTHVVFYSERNLQWIQRHFGFSKLEVNSRLIVFTN
jgi:2-polyprenyl-3-methyl-5-hydroxy-6-metoxy-1,4-benzoquinol methylase